MTQMLSNNSILLNKEVYENMIGDQSLESINQEDGLLKIPSQLFTPYRLLILTARWKWGGLDFKTLKNGTHVKSDGNLASHLRILEELEIIEYKKEFENRRPKTFYQLTPKGKKQLISLAQVVKAILTGIE